MNRFLRNGTDEPECRALVAKFFGAQAPVTTCVVQPPCDGAALGVELWCAGGAGVASVPGVGILREGSGCDDRMTMLSTPLGWPCASPDGFSLGRRDHNMRGRSRNRHFLPVPRTGGAQASRGHSVQGEVKNYVPVTDAMLKNPPAGDWLMARRNYQIGRASCRERV